jgi:GxxExxY protein
MEFEQELEITSPPEYVDDPLTRQIIGCAIKVHRSLGPGLLESAYQACLAYELTKGGLSVEREVPVPVLYDGVRIDCGFRIDLLVEGQVIIELKCVERINAVHEAQLMTYLKLSGIHRGLIMNFNVALLRDGILRRVVGNGPGKGIQPQRTQRSQRTEKDGEA